MNQDGCQNVALCLDPRCHRCWKVQLLCILFLEVQTRMFPLIPCLKGVEDKEMASLARVQKKLLGENLLAVVCDLNYKGCYLHVWSRMVSPDVGLVQNYLEIVMCLFLHFRDELVK